MAAGARSTHFPYIFTRHAPTILAFWPKGQTVHFSTVRFENISILKTIHLTSDFLSRSQSSSSPGARPRISMKSLSRKDGSNQKLRDPRPRRILDTDQLRDVQCRFLSMAKAVLELPRRHKVSMKKKKKKKRVRIIGIGETFKLEILG